MMGFIFDSLYYYYYFLVENSWACRERATCNLLGSPWAWLAVGLALL